MSLYGKLLYVQSCFGNKAGLYLPYNRSPPTSCALTPTDQLPAESLETDSQTISFCHEQSDALQLVRSTRSEEHTSELQSRGHLVCRLLLEKKKEKRKERWLTE